MKDKHNYFMIGFFAFVLVVIVLLFIGYYSALGSGVDNGLVIFFRSAIILVFVFVGIIAISLFLRRVREKREKIGVKIIGKKAKDKV
jgi:uncharacterized membrane protein